MLESSAKSFTEASCEIAELEQQLAFMQINRLTEKDPPPSAIELEQEYKSENGHQNVQPSFNSTVDNSDYPSGDTRAICKSFFKKKNNNYLFLG